MNRAFTLIETIAVLAIIGVIVQFSIVVYRSSVGGSYLVRASDELEQNLRRAQQFSSSGYQDSDWGMYLDTSTPSHRYVIFKGNAYASRDQSFDEVYELPNAISLSSIDVGGGQEVIFLKPHGTTNQIGSVTLQNLEGRSAQVLINSLGRISTGQDFEQQQQQAEQRQPQTVHGTLVGDSYMYKFSPTTNYGSDSKIWVQTWQNSYHQRAAVRFNLSSIPQTATVISARLKLYLFNTHGTVRPYAAHRIIDNPARDWAESAVTWNKFNTGSSQWTVPGGDFVPTATDIQSAGQWLGVGYWVQWNVTSDVQTFVSTPNTNFGWMIKDHNEDATPQYYVWFASKEYADADKRPVLEITYQ